jgi:hypothetical protein
MMRRSQISRRELKSTSDHNLVLTGPIEARQVELRFIPTMLGGIAVPLQCGFGCQCFAPNESTVCSQNRKVELDTFEWRYAPHCRTV